MKKGEKKKGKGFGYWGEGVERSQEFFAMAMDREIGRVLDALDDKGIRDNTLVWFTSDNGGTANNYPKRGSKGSQWDGGVRVPAAVRWPQGFTGGRKLDEMLAYIDIWPTLQRLAGYTETPPKPIDGIDVLDILAGKPAPDRTLYLGKNTVILNVGNSATTDCMTSMPTRAKRKMLPPSTLNRSQPFPAR